MFGVKQRLTTLGHQMCKARRQVFDVFCQRDPKRSCHMKFVAFTDQTDGGRVRIHHRSKHIIIASRPTRPLSHTKGGHGRACFWSCIKEIRIRRVRARPTAFDVVDPKIIQHRCYLLLFSRRELHTLGLLPVAKCGVEQIKSFFGHHTSPSLAASKSGPGVHVACPPTSVTCTPALFRMSRTSSAKPQSFDARAAAR